MNEELRKKKSDYLLELALEEQMEHDVELEKYNSNNETEVLHIFSEKHNKRMKRIFILANKIENKPKRLKQYRQMAAGFALILCICVYSVTQVEAFRIPIIRFIMEVKEKSTLFETNVKENTVLTEYHEKYMPQYIPDGFEIQNIEEDKEFFRITYINVQKQQGFRFYFTEDVGSSDIDTEDGFTESIEINGNQAYVVQKGDEIRILMNRNSNLFYLIGDLSDEEAIRILKSIK